MGPRPLYCAEHIESDPTALYHKCGFVLSAPDHRGKEKKCKEIVYKDFKRCYKHFTPWIAEELSGEDKLEKTKEKLEVAWRLAEQLEAEAIAAKGEDQELYQRKSKILPKYQSMAKSLGDYLKQIDPEGKVQVSRNPSPSSAEGEPVSDDSSTKSVTQEDSTKSTDVSTTVVSGVAEEAASTTTLNSSSIEQSKPGQGEGPTGPSQPTSETPAPQASNVASDGGNVDGAKDISIKEEDSSDVKPKSSLETSGLSMKNEGDEGKVGGVETGTEVKKEGSNDLQSDVKPSNGVVSTAEVPVPENNPSNVAGTNSHQSNEESDGSSTSHSA